MLEKAKKILMGVTKNKKNTSKIPMIQDSTVCWAESVNFFFTMIIKINEPNQKKKSLIPIFSNFKTNTSRKETYT